MAREPQEDSDAFITEVCWNYFINGLTQAEVAAAMGVTRLRVNQAIQKGRACGIVQVQIDAPFVTRLELQQDVQDALGIDKALVVPADRKDYDCHGPVGAGLAALLSDRMATRKWSSIGVSWGLTLYSAIRRLSRQQHPGLEVVSILGGTSQGSSFNAFAIASGFADILGAHYSVLTAPIYLSKGIDRDLFLEQDVLRTHFDKFATLDAAILTCSDVSPKSFLVAHGLPRDLSPETLIAIGAIGDVLGQFLDAEGNSVSAEIDRRTVGMTLDQAMQIPERIMAAAGPHKVRILAAAAQRGLFQTLVTDDVTAEHLLAYVRTGT